MKYYRQMIVAYLNEQENALTTYSQDMPEDLIEALAEAIEVYEIMLQAILDVQHNDRVYLERKDIADSIYFVERGLELVNSYLFLLCFGHYPAPLFLLRSILNQFWFSHCSLVNYSPKSTNKRFYDEYEAERPHMSRFEIKMDILAKIIGKNDYDRKDNIINWYNAILHGSFEAASMWQKTEQDYCIRPSPAKMSGRCLRMNYEPALVHIRGVLEFCRVIMHANYVIKEPERIFQNLFDPDHMRLGNAAVYAIFLSQVQDAKLELESLPCNL
jgi:hypothetical protein